MKRLIATLIPIFLTLCQVKPEEYTAAVVEFYPEQNKSLKPDERLKNNVDGYLKILNEISQNKTLDIVVFPESTLATNSIIDERKDLIPYSVELSVSQSLCTTQNTTFFTPLACAAQNIKTYLVVNLYERAPCQSECVDNWDFYNTNVVLDRNGTVISKYRKFNLFGEFGIKKTSTADISIFDTDFGEQFASFICFDILFKEPALDLVMEHKISSIIYPTMWFSELPFLTALQAQQQWAYATNSTLLSSGANDPKRGSGGSGIHRGTDGPLVIDMLGNTQSKAFVVTVSGQSSSLADKRNDEVVDKKAAQMDDFFLLQDKLDPYTSKIISVGQKEITDSVCHEKICCNFKISIGWNNETLEAKKNFYLYHMVAFDGVRSYSGVYNGGVEICGVVACMDHDLKSCGKRFPSYQNVSWPAIFKRIEIKATFDNDTKKYQHPNSLLSDIQPLPVEDFEWTSSILLNSTVERTYILKKPQNRLMTFAIYGRDFNRDGPNSNNIAITPSWKITCLFTLIVLNFCL